MKGHRMSHEAKLIQKILAEETDPSDDQHPLAFNFEVCIDIGDGRKGILRIDQKSDALQCALEFCHEYDLDEVIAGILCQSIKEKIDNERKAVYKAATAERRSRMSQSGEWQRERSVHRQERALREITTEKLSNSMNVFPAKQKQRTESQQLLSSQQEMEQFYHQPKINEISRIIADKLQKKSIVEEVEVNRRKKEAKVDRLKKQLEQKELAQCSFKPKINMISEKVDSEIKRQSSCLSNKRYEQLYQQSFAIEGKREHQRNKSSENMKFKPEINRISRTLVSGMTFEQRQERFRHNKQEPTQVNAIPRTGRNPRSRNRSGMPIGDYLYSKAKKSQQRASVVILRPTEHRLTALGKSEHIVNNLKQCRLKQIFDLLDSNGDGRIRYQEIQQDALDSQIMQIFLPILQQMRELDIELDQSQFLQAADRLLDTLSLQQRTLILNTRKRVDPGHTYSFKPQINKKYLNSSQFTQDLYTRGLQDKKKLRDKLQRQKEELARAELTQCTFKPKIIRYSNPLYTNIG